MARGAGELVAAYARGMVTRVEAVSKLVDLAADLSPAAIAAGLPADWLADVRRHCEEYLACPPPRRVLVLTSVCNGPGYDADRARREAEGRALAGLSAWLAFFGLGAGGAAEPGAADVT